MYEYTLLCPSFLSLHQGLSVGIGVNYLLYVTAVVCMVWYRYIVRACFGVKHRIVLRTYQYTYLVRSAVPVFRALCITF